MGLKSKHFVSIAGSSVTTKHHHCTHLSSFLLWFTRKKKKSKKSHKDLDEPPTIAGSTSGSAGSSSGGKTSREDLEEKYYSKKTKTEIAFLKRKEESVSWNSIICFYFNTYYIHFFPIKIYGIRNYEKSQWGCKLLHFVHNEPESWPLELGTSIFF